jgi:hypothetical protein
VGFRGTACLEEISPFSAKTFQKPEFVEKSEIILRAGSARLQNAKSPPVKAGFLFEFRRRFRPKRRRDF